MYEFSITSHPILLLKYCGFDKIIHEILMDKYSSGACDFKTVDS